MQKSTRPNLCHNQQHTMGRSMVPPVCVFASQNECEESLDSVPMCDRHPPQGHLSLKVATRRRMQCSAVQRSKWHTLCERERTHFPSPKTRCLQSRTHQRLLPVRGMMPYMSGLKATRRPVRVTPSRAHTHALSPMHPQSKNPMWPGPVLCSHKQPSQLHP
jgi:hypothetical protein